MTRSVSSAIGLCAVLVFAPWMPARAQALFDAIGATRLWNELGTNRPTGAGIAVGMVEGVSGAAYRPDPADPDFAGKTFYDITANSHFTNFSAHATSSGRRFFGISNSVAPGITQIDCYESGDWLFEGFLNALSGTNVYGRGPPLVAPRRVYNFSVVAIGNWTNAQRRIDFAVERDGFTIVGALPNDPPGPSVVGGMLAGAYNVITVGRTDGQHAPGYSQFDTPGRSKPDLVVPLGFTSFATPVVAGAAAMLLQVVDANPALGLGGRPQSIKAILMAGATKDEFPDWQRTPDIPLDDTFGAGELNIYNSHQILTAGRQPPHPTNSVELLGWDYQTLSGATNRVYFLDVPPGYWMNEWSCVLTWHRRVFDIEPGPDFVPDIELADLDLFLRDTIDGAPAAVRDRSTSRIDNVEHIFVKNLRPGRYAIEVTADQGADYALAWRGDLIPVAGGGPFTLTAHSEVHFQLTATPSSIPPQSGDGTAEHPFVYHLGDEALDMAGYAIRSTTSNYSARITVASLAYNTTSPAGGVIDFSGALKRGHLALRSDGAVHLREVLTHSTSAGNGTGGGGDIDVDAAQGLVVTGRVLASAVGSNNRGGAIRLIADGGIVRIGGEISATSAAYAGQAFVRGRSVALSNVFMSSASASRPGGEIAIRATDGALHAGELRSFGGTSGGPGPVTVRADNGNVWIGSVDARHINVSGTASASGAVVEVSASGSLRVGGVDVSVLRTNANAAVDFGSPIRLYAGGDVSVTGALRARVNSLPTNASLRSRGGPITVVSSNGSIWIAVAPDAFSPAGIWNGTNWSGALSLSAPAGGITLRGLDVNLVGAISLTSSVAIGTAILGPLIGLDTDIVDNVVHRFAAVRGDVFYDAFVPQNAYLQAREFPIAHSIGGAFALKPLGVPTVEGFAWSGGGMRAATLGASGRVYRLWYTTNLLEAPVKWHQADFATGLGTTLELLDAAPPDPMRVYRMSAE